MIAIGILTVLAYNNTIEKTVKKKNKGILHGKSPEAQITFLHRIIYAPIYFS